MSGRTPKHLPFLLAAASLTLALADVAGAAVTYTWNSANGAWGVAANWTPARSAPALDDILVFDGAVISNATATAVPTQTIGQLRVVGGGAATFTATSNVALTINGDAGDDLLVSAGSTLVFQTSSSVSIVLASGASGSISGEFAVAGANHRILPTDAGSMVFESGSDCRTLIGFIGNLFGNTGTNDVVVFRSGSTYHHAGGLHPFGKTAPDSRVILESGSLIRYLGTFGNGAFTGRTYGDCELDAPVSIIGPVSCTIDNLTLISGGFNYTASAPWTMSIKGSLTKLPAGTFTLNPSSGSATVSFSGTGAQTIDMQNPTLGTFSNLDVVNPAGLALGRYLFTDGTVTLSGGHLTTGPYLLHLGHIATVVGPQWVVGNLGRLMPGSAGAITRTFEVGDALRAAHLTIAFASVGDTGTVRVRTDLGDHPGLVASGLVPSQSVNRTWKVDNLGMSFTTCDVTLNFDPADVDPGADPNTFFVGRHDGSSWSLPSVGTRTATSTQATGLTAFSDFVVAESGPTGVDPRNALTAALAPPRPTPFQESTVLEYSLARAGHLELSIHAVNGARIRTLALGRREAGEYRVTWDGRDGRGHSVPPGIYLARFVTEEGRHHRRVIKIR